MHPRPLNPPASAHNPRIFSGEPHSRAPTSQRPDQTGMANPAHTHSLTRHYQSTLDAVYVYVVPWLEFPIISSHPHHPQLTWPVPRAPSLSIQQHPARRPTSAHHRASCAELEKSTVTQVNSGSNFVWRRSTLDFCLGGQGMCSQMFYVSQRCLRRPIAVYSTYSAAELRKCAQKCFRAIPVIVGHVVDRKSTTQRVKKRPTVTGIAPISPEMLCSSSARHISAELLRGRH